MTHQLRTGEIYDDDDDDGEEGDDDYDNDSEAGSEDDYTAWLRGGGGQPRPRGPVRMIPSEYERPPQQLAPSSRPTGRPPRQQTRPSAPPRQTPRPSPRPESTRGRQRDARVEDIVRVVSAELITASPRQMNLSSVYDLLWGCIDRAGANVQKLQVRSGGVWDEERIVRAFHTELKRLGEEALENHFSSDLGDNIVEHLITGALPTGGSGGDGATVGAGHPLGAGGMIPEGVIGRPARSTFNIDSSARNRSIGSGPNVIQVPLIGSGGLSLHPPGLQVVSGIELLEVKMNMSGYFSARQEGVVFYIRIDEIVDDFNRQSNIYDGRCHFKCSAKLRRGGSVVDIMILTNKVIIPSPMNLNGNLTFRFYTSRMQPLPVEQDIYSILGYVVDNVNQRVILALPRHSIRTGDDLSIRGFQCVEDSSLFADDKNLRAQVIDLTHVAILAWRTAPFTIVTSGAHVICINNVIRLSIGINHYV